MREAYKGPDSYFFWLTSEKYADAPKKRLNQGGQDGTIPPIQESFKSGFVGKKVEDVAKWLQEKPDDVDLDSHHFAILDRRTENDGTIVICRIGNKDLEGDELDYTRLEANLASLHLGGMEYGTWEELSATTEIEY